MSKALSAEATQLAATHDIEKTRAILVEDGGSDDTTERSQEKQWVQVVKGGRPTSAACSVPAYRVPKAQVPSIAVDGPAAREVRSTEDEWKSAKHKPTEYAT